VVPGRAAALCRLGAGALQPEVGAACDPMKARATRDKEPEGGPAPTQPQGETPRGGGGQHRGNLPANSVCDLLIFLPQAFQVIARNALKTQSPPPIFLMFSHPRVNP